MRERIARFMAGRNGNDQLNVFLLIVNIILAVAGSIIGGTVGSALFIVVLLLLGFTYFRMLSKNVYKRRSENERYMRAKYKISAWFKAWHERWIQRKDYKFFSCPQCKTVLRVPRGHGKIKIVCRKCGNSFIGKS